MSTLFLSGFRSRLRKGLGLGPMGAWFCFSWPRTLALRGPRIRTNELRTRRRLAFSGWSAGRLPPWDCSLGRWSVFLGLGKQANQPGVAIPGEGDSLRSHSWIPSAFKFGVLQNSGKIGVLLDWLPDETHTHTHKHIDLALFPWGCGPDAACSLPPQYWPCIGLGPDSCPQAPFRPSSTNGSQSQPCRKYCWKQWAYPIAKGVYVFFVPRNGLRVHPSGIFTLFSAQGNYPRPEPSKW